MCGQCNCCCDGVRGTALTASNGCGCGCCRSCCRSRCCCCRCCRDCDCDCDSGLAAPTATISMADFESFLLVPTTVFDRGDVDCGCSEAW